MHLASAYSESHVPARVSPSLALPLIGSLLLTGTAVSLYCSPPLHPVLTWGKLIALAFLYVGIAACVHAATVWVVRRLFHEHIRVSALPLVFATWISVAWLPLLALLDKEGSLLVAAVLPFVIVSAMIFIRHWRVLPESGPEDDEVVEPISFGIYDPAPMWKMLVPAVLTALALQASIATLLNGWRWTAGILFSVACIFPVWKLAEARPTGARARSLVAKSVIIIALTGFALTPFLKRMPVDGDVLGMLSRFSQIKGFSLPQPVAPQSVGHRPGEAQSAIVLVLPKKPHEELKPPQPHVQTRMGAAIAKPMVIPFDGVYWYFQYPDKRPPRDAEVQRGDPLKAHIRATNYVPLRMEAHQSLGTAMGLDCCRTLRIDYTNADSRPGKLSLEVVLKNTRTKEEQWSLGTIVIPSSTVSPMPMNRAPVDESLQFRLAALPHGEKFDEITVRIIPVRDRDMAGSQVAIKSFTFVP